MIKRISVDDLTVGMYIHDFQCSWFSHPFLTNRLFVSDENLLNKVLDSEVKYVAIDTELGVDVQESFPSSDSYPPSSGKINCRTTKKPLISHALELADERARACRLHKAAHHVVQNFMGGVRLGGQVDIERIEPTLEGMLDSIFRNQNALLPLSRLRSHDTYTFEHSVNVCVLMLAFGRTIGLDKEVVKEVGLGALLHDAGKARIPDSILNKPDKLNQVELDYMHAHVALGLEALSSAPRVSHIALSVVGEHHERYDGYGYPNGLRGSEISLYGRMAAIVDVYDALSSDRTYHKAIEPARALKQLVTMSDTHFDRELVHEFIRVIGIYPTGSLVKLRSGKLGVVVEQNKFNLLEPVVRVFFSAHRNHYIYPELVDISKSSDQIVSHEDFHAWGLDVEACLIV